MLVIESQPEQIRPNHLGHPIQWIIRKSDYILQQGERPLLGFSFVQDNAGASGQTFTILDNEFTTDDAQPYTNTSFDYVAGRLNAAENFANMLRSSYLFVGWSIWVADAGIATVFAQRDEPGEIPSDEFVVDLTTLAPGVPIQRFEGQNEIVSTDRMWYQLWENNTPLTERKVAGFDPSGRARVEAEPTARRLLGITSPYLLWSIPRRDERMTRRIYLKFGSYSSVDCNLNFGRVYESSPITIINNVVQHEYLFGLAYYHQAFTPLVRWLSRRRGEYLLCGTSYDWLAIYLARTPGFLSGFFRVEYYFYDDADEQIGTATDGLSNVEDGVYHIPVGAANPIAAQALIAAASYWTVQVLARNEALEYVPYSELMTIRKKSCNCKGAEVYFKEELGSWRSVAFERVDERLVDVTAVEWVNPLQGNQKGRYGPENAFQLYLDGGDVARTAEAERRYILVSERLTNSNRGLYEELAKSSHHFLLSFADPLGVAVRRINIERGVYGLLKNGEAVRFVVPFTFNTKDRVA